MYWFGESWGAPVCDESERVVTPRSSCLGCREPIVQGDRGVVLPFITGEGVSELGPYHLDCFTRALGLPNPERARRNPETCPNHPPASSLDAIACRDCGAFKMKIDTSKMPRAVLELAFKLLADVAAADPHPYVRDVLIPWESWNAILVLLQTAAEASR